MLETSEAIFPAIVLVIGGLFFLFSGILTWGNNKETKTTEAFVFSLLIYLISLVFFSAAVVLIRHMV